MVRIVPVDTVRIVQILVEVVRIPACGLMGVAGAARFATEQSSKLSELFLGCLAHVLEFLLELSIGIEEGGRWVTRTTASTRSSTATRIHSTARNN